MSRIVPVEQPPASLDKFKNDFTYFNVIINNNSQVPKLASYNEQRDCAIISDMENYYMSVDRFRVNTGTIPIFLFSNPSTYTARIYNITTSTPVGATQTVDYNAGIVGTYIQSAGQQPIYSYNQFITMVNEQLTIIAATSGLPVGTEIILRLNPDTNKLQLVIAGDYVNSVAIFVWAADHGIEVSPSLYPFLNAFDSVRLNNGNYVIRLSIGEFLPVNIYARPENPPVDVTFVVNAEYNNLPTWHSLRRIIFTTGSLPINSEQIASSVNGQTGRPITLQIITDFEAPQDPSGALDNNLYYFNENGRKINITGNGVLSKFDVKVFYQDKNLELYPLYIAPNESLEMKISFKRRKDASHKQY